MSRYRRVWVPGGTYFFTVNLLERRRTLLVDRIDDLRAAFRAAHATRPFTMEAIVILPDTCIACGACRTATPTTPRAGGTSKPCSRGVYSEWRKAFLAPRTKG